MAILWTQRKNILNVMWYTKNRFQSIKIWFWGFTSLDKSEVNTVWTWGDKRPPPPISKYFNKNRVPSGIRAHDLPHDSPRRYPLRHNSFDEATHGICVILSWKNKFSPQKSRKNSRFWKKINIWNNFLRAILKIEGDVCPPNVQTC